MADLCILDLSEARAALAQDSPALGAAARTLTSESTMDMLSGASGIGGFHAAKFGRLTEDWSAGLRTLNEELMSDLRRLRSRARSMAINSPLISKYLQMCRTNVAGPNGVRLDFRLPQQTDPSSDGLPAAVDSAASEALSRAWRSWGARGSCTVCGNFSLDDLQRVCVETAARDGEVLLRLIPTPKSTNPFGLQLELINADRLDETYNLDPVGGKNRIVMGVEVTPRGLPVAYHLWDADPYSLFGHAKRERVPASQIIHYYVPRRPSQVRGYPWIAPAMLRTHMLEGYAEAEVVAARISASVVMSMETDPNAPATDFQGDGLTADGGMAVDIGPGKAIQLPAGMKLSDHTPAHPTTAFSAFVSAAQREIASGLNVSYYKLANDLAGINYSSGRLGELEEREMWKEMQQVFIDRCLRPILSAWLRQATLTGAIRPTLERQEILDYYSRWLPRRWGWVDPLKDVQASTLLVQNGFQTQQGILQSEGIDFDDLCQQRKYEQDRADALGLKFGTDIRGMGTAEVNAGPDTTQDDESSSGEVENPPEQAAAKPTVPAAAVSKPALKNKGGSVPPKTKK